VRIYDEGIEEYTSEVIIEDVVKVDQGSSEAITVDWTPTSGTHLIRVEVEAEEPVEAAKLVPVDAADDVGPVKETGPMMYMAALGLLAIMLWVALGFTLLRKRRRGRK
jgi:hypothetical protein